MYLSLKKIFSHCQCTSINACVCLYTRLCVYFRKWPSVKKKERLRIAILKNPIDKDHETRRRAIKRHRLINHPGGEGDDWNYCGANWQFVANGESKRQLDRSLSLWISKLPA